MAFLGLILFFAIAALFVMPIVALVQTKSFARAFRDEMAGMMDRIRDLEAQLRKLAAERGPSTAAPTAQAAQAAPAPAPAAPAAPPTAKVEQQRPPQPPPVPDPWKTHAAPPAPAPAQTAASLHPPAGASFLPAVPQAAPQAASQATRQVAPLAAPIPSPPAPPIPPAPAPPPHLFEQISYTAAVSYTPAEKAARAERALNLEERLGTNWLNKIGIALLVLGVAFFLAWKLQTWGPAGKVLCGFAVSLTLLAGGVWLERKPIYRIFARAGIGGGWALAFFTTFAMHHIPAARVLDSLVADLVLMLLVAAGMVAHSLRYRSQAVTGLAFLLGFATLLTSHVQASSETVIFSLTGSAVLALGLVIVTYVRHWTALEAVGLVAVYGTHFVWLTQVLPQNHASFAEFWPSVFLILLYWLIFRLAYVLRTPLNQNEENISSLTAVMNGGGVLALLKYQAAHPEWAWWALAALGTCEMALAFTARARRRQAFVVLSTVATVLLVAAVPFKFHGVSWPVLWLVEAQVLALCGLRMGEPVFRRLGLLAGLATGAVLAVHDVAPLVFFRLNSSDPQRHVSLTVALVLAALLYWIHGEVYPRRWPQILESGFESAAMSVTSFLAAAAAAGALWVALPSQWVVVGWLVLTIVLGFAADRFKAGSLALQAHLLAASAVVAWFPWNLWNGGAGWWDHKAPELAAIALLYAGMARKTAPEGLRAPGAGAYSWVASALLAIAAWDLSPSLYLAVVWVALGVALFEVGRFTAKTALRWQGFVLAGLAFALCIFLDIDSGGPAAPAGNPAFSFVNSALLEVLVLAAAGYWLLERTMNHERTGQGEHIAGTIADGLGTLAIALWFAFRFPSTWVPAPNGDVWVTAVWAGMAALIIALAWTMRRRASVVWAIVLAVAVVVRGLIFDLADATPLGFWQGPLFHLGVAALILLVALPFAFQLRKPALWEGGSIQLPPEIITILRRSDQWFFFAPFALMAVALAVKLSSGHITIAWSILGVVVFLFALAVGERSYRLAGLGLLLVSVAKILLMDVWALAPPDRYMTLIVMGLALLGVSFLYTRFGTVIRRYL